MQLIKKIIATILSWEARIVLARTKPKIIAVTGSVGKTSTKDAIFAVISPHVHARKSEKSFNSEFGVPLTILGLESGWNDPLKWLINIVRGLILAIAPGAYPTWLVLEVGADRPGDIRHIAKWLRPDVAVITAIPEVPVHVEYFDSPQAVLREKRTLAEYLKPGGTLVMNGDDPHLSDLPSRYEGHAMTYGFAETNAVVASDDVILYDAGLPSGISYNAAFEGAHAYVRILGSLGRPRIYASLAAIAVGSVVGVDLASAADNLSRFPAPSGRMRILLGIRGSLVIDDTYNSSPVAALAALDTLAQIATNGRKIAVMGDMLELGKYSTAAHRDVGTRAAGCVDMLVSVGFRARMMAEAALDAGMPDSAIRQYEQGESARAGLELEKELRAGDIVLVKGSQSMRMERTVENILPPDSPVRELLVRQDAQWKSR